MPVVVGKKHLWEMEIGDVYLHKEIADVSTVFLEKDDNALAMANHHVVSFKITTVYGWSKYSVARRFKDSDEPSRPKFEKNERG